MRRTTFAAVVSVREYRVIWLAQILSVVGDQLAIIALTWLVFERSRSALLASATFAIGYVPWLLGGLLSGLADRNPRREVMVACDLARAGLVFLIALPIPLWLACLLLFVTELLAPPFSSARAAVLPDILPGEQYILGTAIGNITNQLGQLLGFAFGGALVAAVEPGFALVLDSVSFLLSAALISWGVSYRPAARFAQRGDNWLLGDARSGVRLVLFDPTLRTLTGFALLCVFYVVPEGLAVPYARQLGGGPSEVGLLLAAGPAGAVAGSVLLARWVSPRRRMAMMGPLAASTCLPLIACLTRPGIGWSLAILGISGLATSFQMVANAAFVVAVPAEMRGQAFGVVQGAMSVGQGAAIIAAGALASWWSPTTVVSVAGALGLASAAWLTRGWRAGSAIASG